MRTNHQFRSFALAAALGIGLAVCPAFTQAQDLVNGSFEDPIEAANSLTEITATGIPGVSSPGQGLTT